MVPKLLNSSVHHVAKPFSIVVINVLKMLGSYPIQGLCSSQCISKGKHNHFSTELFRKEFWGISHLHQEESVGMRVRIVLSESC